MTALYAYVQRAAFCDFTGIQLYLDGWETQQKGVWKYTLPCILCACATFPA